MGQVDLAVQALTLESGKAVEFAIDAFSKTCLLEGIDELGFVLKHEDAIGAYESANPPAVDTRLVKA